MLDAYQSIREDLDGRALDFRISLDFATNRFRIHELIVVPPGKRSGRKVIFELTEHPEWRELSKQNRRKRELAEILKYTSLEVVNDVLLEAWYNLLPPRLTEKDAAWAAEFVAEPTEVDGV